MKHLYGMLVKKVIWKYNLVHGMELTGDQEIKLRIMHQANYGVGGLPAKLGLQPRVAVHIRVWDPPQNGPIGAPAIHFKLVFVGWR